MIGIDFLNLENHKKILDSIKNNLQKFWELKLQVRVAIESILIWQR